MTALSESRCTPERPGLEYSLGATAAVHVYAGSLVVMDSSGNAKPGVAATGLVALGRASAEVDNSAGLADALQVPFRAGIFRWENSADADAITKADIGSTCYIVDDQTVAKTNGGATRSPAGVIRDVDDVGVWVDTPMVWAALGGLTAANNLSDVANAATARGNLGLGSSDSPTFAAVTSTGAVTAGSVVSAGTSTGRQKTHTVAAGAYTVTANDGGISIAAAADNDVVTLPDAAAGNKGLRVTVQNRGADGAAKVSVSPHSSDKIVGGVHGAAGGDLVSFSGAADKDAINTKATAKQGDYLVLESDGVDSWWVVGGKGVWASED